MSEKQTKRVTAEKNVDGAIKAFERMNEKNYLSLSTTEIDLIVWSMKLSLSDRGGVYGKELIINNTDFLKLLMRLNELLS